MEYIFSVFVPYACAFVLLTIGLFLVVVGIRESVREIWKLIAGSPAKGGLRCAEVRSEPTTPRPSKPPCGQGISSNEYMANRIARQIVDESGQAWYVMRNPRR